MAHKKRKNYLINITAGTLLSKWLRKKKIWLRKSKMEK
jgi:hypothetical protein